MTKNLNDLQPGQKGTIAGICGSGPVHRRMLDLGLLPGAMLSVSGIAPLGDPIAVRIGGATLSLRREEAASISVETG